ncbi:MAG: phosphoribosylglycinamide formyltransferase 2 [Candidatus Hecatellales archaeon B24]|nr:MAG: phosphoribosylglycinamide formyltransferase 2 [Candidatus Hecatellales archaeon B24]
MLVGGKPLAENPAEERLRLLSEAEAFKREFERKLTPIECLSPRSPAVFISVGGGELGDLALTAAGRLLGGANGGVRTVVFDRYEGFPAQDSADAYEIFDMLNGDMLEEAVKKYIPDPDEPHAIYLEIERVDTFRVCKLGIEDGYRVASTPYGPLICMDRHMTKLMFDRLNLPRVEWAYAGSPEEIRKAARDFNLPVIIKPLMTSSGHGTTIAHQWSDVEEAYDFAVKHARGKGSEVVVERFLPELKSQGTEITQLVVRHFDGDGKIVTSMLPPVEHRRPGATYHESWLPATIPEEAVRKCQESAGKIAEFIGGLGIFAVEQFYVEGKVYNNEVANRPHDTGMITRWMLNLDEGAVQLLSTLGLPILKRDLELARSGVYGVAHVVLAPKRENHREAPVKCWKLWEVKRYMEAEGYQGDLWYFGKPAAYPGRRMGLAVAFHENLEEARRRAEEIAHYTEDRIFYG